MLEDEDCASKADRSGSNATASESDTDGEASESTCSQSELGDQRDVDTQLNSSGVNLVSLAQRARAASGDDSDDDSEVEENVAEDPESDSEDGVVEEPEEDIEGAATRFTELSVGRPRARRIAESLSTPSLACPVPLSQKQLFKMPRLEDGDTGATLWRSRSASRCTVKLAPLRQVVVDPLCIRPGAADSLSLGHASWRMQAAPRGKLLGPRLGETRSASAGRLAARLAPLAPLAR